MIYPTAVSKPLDNPKSKRYGNSKIVVRLWGDEYQKNQCYGYGEIIVRYKDKVRARL